MKQKKLKAAISLLCLMFLVMTGTGWTQPADTAPIDGQDFISSENMEYTVYCSPAWRAEIALENPGSSPYVIREGIQVLTEYQEVFMIDTFRGIKEKTIGEWIKNNPYVNPDPLNIQLTKVSKNKFPAITHFQAGGNGVPDVLYIYFLKDSQVYRFSYWQKYGGKSIREFWNVVNSFEDKASPGFFVKENSSHSILSPNPEMREWAISGFYQDGDWICGGEVEYRWGPSYCWWCTPNPYDCCPNDGNCVWYAYLALCGSSGHKPTWCGFPSQWVNLAKGAGWKVRSTPSVGAIGVNSGHVAYVQWVNGNTISIREQSCGEYAGGTHTRTVSVGEFGDYITRY